MIRHDINRILCLGVAAASLSWPTNLAAAPKAPPAKPGQTVTVVDAAGRRHVYHAPITDTHRKAVGAKMKAAKAKKAKVSK